MFRVDVRVVGNARADIGVKAETLARGDVQAFVSASLGSGDRGFVENFGAAQRFPRTGFDTGRVAAKVNLFADVNRFNFKSRAGLQDDVQRGLHDFGADAVAMRNCNRGFLGH